MIPEIDLWHDGRGKRAILSKDESVPCNSSMPHRLLYFHPSSLEGIPNPNDESKLTYLPVPYRRDGDLNARHVIHVAKVVSIFLYHAA